ncbi:MAG: class I SAM-dependent methyltransferase [Bacteroidales bacterium]
MDCPLCHTPEHTIIHAMQNRTLYACTHCKLVYAAPTDLLEPSDEKERYLEHENSIEHPGYVKFLMQAINESVPYLTKGEHGLDFGCGPGPTLSLLMKQRGFTCDDYDPLFFPTRPNGLYDFIYATECFEHFYQPDNEIEYIGSLLKKQGILIIMTEPYNDTTNFARWYYASDPTHVCFYNTETFNYISKTFSYIQLPSQNPRVTILQKK